MEQTDPIDKRTFVERAARSVAKKGLRYEQSLKKARIPKAYAGFNMNFLIDPEDPFHGYYRQKLSEYLSQIQEHGDIIEPYGSTEIIEPPPKIRRIIERAAFYLSRKGSDAEQLMKVRNRSDENYRFLYPLNPFHAFYRQKLDEYRCQNQQDGVSNDQDAAATDEAQEPEPKELN